MDAEKKAPFSAVADRLPQELIAALKTAGITHMSEVQEKVLNLPDLQQDCLVRAKTGTGKTIAFLLPTLTSLLANRNSLPRGQVGILVLAPTRELAVQISQECEKLTKYIKPPIECHLAYGGVNKNQYLSKFQQGNPTVLAATPGRLLEYLSDPEVRSHFINMRALVLDEADRLLDPGFILDVKKILPMLPSKAQAKWQGMCFSATMTPKMEQVLHHVLAPNCTRISTVSADDVPTIEKVPQSVIATSSIKQSFAALHAVLTDAQRETPDLKAIIFASTARNAGLLFQLFEQAGVAPGGLKSLQMQSRMSQPARSKTTEAFKTAKRGLLFASDVVGRGVDFPDVDLVVQFGHPSDKEQYVHRVGRTGRAGKSGRAVMILSPEEMPFFKQISNWPVKRAPLPSVPSSTGVIENAMTRIPESAKGQAYQAFLGFMKDATKITGMNTTQVVQMANSYSEAMGCKEPPALLKRVIGKMGLKGVKGLRIQQEEVASEGAFNRGHRQY